MQYVTKALPLLLASAAVAQPYDFSAATTLLNAELQDLRGHVAVLLRQDGREIYRFQAGDIGHGSKTHLASFTKTLSAAVVLSLVDDGRLSLDEHLGDVLPTFASNGVGAPTLLDCFGMRHGLRTPIAYEHDRRYTLAQSVTLIGATATLGFTPGTRLEYDGAGMQSVGRICELRGLRSWETLARDRIFTPCAMPNADYLEFDPNPAIAGGARASADETINFAQMIIDDGVFAGARVLSSNAIERLFTNSTLNLPVEGSPFPPTHPLYPYGVDPDYGFGDWIFAQHPQSQHVEEIVGAGAWGSFIWVDRRRALTAVLITDVPAGSQASVDAAFGLFAIARQQTETAQCTALHVARQGSENRVAWTIPAGAIGARVVGSFSPIRDIFDLRAAQTLSLTTADHATATPFPYYAVIASFAGSENPALVPGGNSLAAPASCPADFSADGGVDGDDVIAFFGAWDAADIAADLTLDQAVDGDDVIAFFERWDAGC